MNNNYVLSYINPDTDGVACSIAMAKFLSSKNEKWISGVLGSIGEETVFILQSLEIPFPDTNIVLDEVEKIVLVDTHHKSQLPMGFPYSKVVSIIDHHPNGDEDLFPTASITNQKIGAAASLVAEMYIEKGIVDIPILKLLAFAILSNTLNFFAPSSTEFDKKIFKRLCDIAPIDFELVDKMFERRSSILKKDIYTALKADFKVFYTKLGRVGISQIEAYNLENMIDISQCAVALQQIANEKGINLCLFNGVDIKFKRSIVIAANNQSQQLLSSLFDLSECKESHIFNRILLRKTDFVPQLNV